VLGSTEVLQGYVGASPGLGSPGCLGKVIPGYQARVVNEMGQDVPPHEKGVLMIKGDSAASGYWNRHEESKKTFQGEWLYTGDTVFEGDDGIYWYVGRADEMFKIAGHWVSPTEIEEVTNSHPWVAESAVVACNDANGLVTMVLYISCPENINVSSSRLDASLREYLTSRLPAHKFPRTIRQLPKLPRSSTGKLQRFKLKELLTA
jgi:acyl-coenzyme A synthetase/AMP-(fatty) acid ligase